MFQFTKNAANVFIALQYPVEPGETTDQEAAISSRHLIGPRDFITVTLLRQINSLKLFVVLFLHDLPDSLARGAARIRFRQGRQKIKSFKNQDFEILGTRTTSRLVPYFVVLGCLFGGGAGVSEETSQSVYRLAA